MKSHFGVSFEYHLQDFQSYKDGSFIFIPDNFYIILNSTQHFFTKLPELFFLLPII